MKWFLPALLLLVAKPLFAAPEAADIAAHRALAAQDVRLATVGYRLAKANAPFCSAKQGFNPGWVLHDIGVYPDAATARAAFGFSRPVEISGIVAGGAAEEAGFRVGDGIVAVNGRDIATLVTGDSPATARLDTLRQLMTDIWWSKYLATVTIERQGTVSDIAFRLDPVCVSHFWVDTRDRIDAGADGGGVRLTSGMMEYVPDDELAYVVAHELAHNVLDHRTFLNGLKRGKTKATYQTEVEADRLSVWLMANAGYDVQAALRFAERYGRKYGGGIFAIGTHPRWQKRVASMRAEIQAIEATPPVNGLRAPPLLVPK